MFEDEEDFSWVDDAIEDLSQQAGEIDEGRISRWDEDATALATNALEQDDTLSAWEHNLEFGYDDDLNSLRPRDSRPREPHRQPQGQGNVPSRSESASGAASIPPKPKMVINVTGEATQKQIDYIGGLLRQLGSTKAEQNAEFEAARKSLKLSSRLDRSDTSRMISYLKKRAEAARSRRHPTR
jgi:hypothetical protein